MRFGKNDILLALTGSQLEIASDCSGVRRQVEAQLPRLAKGVLPHRQPLRDAKQTSRCVHATTDSTAVAQGSDGRSHTSFHAQMPTLHRSRYSLGNVGAEPIKSWQSGCSASSLIGNVWAKSKHKDGCLEVQKALSHGDNENRVAIASELRGLVWDAVESPNANHVLQRCIENMSPHALQFILDELMCHNGAATRLAKHEYGCRVFERILEFFRADQVQQMVKEVLMDVGTLVQDLYGNYVLQHIFEYGEQDMKRQLALALMTRMSRLVTDHRTAAVIAKALEHAPAEEKRSIAKSLLQAPMDFVQMATQRFGEAVAVAVLKLPGREGAQARNVLSRGDEHLKQFRYGRAVLKFMKQSAPDVTDRPQRLVADGGA